MLNTYSTKISDGLQGFEVPTSNSLNFGTPQVKTQQPKIQQQTQQQIGRAYTKQSGSLTQQKMAILSGIMDEAMGRGAKPQELTKALYRINKQTGLFTLNDINSAVTNYEKISSMGATPTGNSINVGGRNFDTSQMSMSEMLALQDNSRKIKDDINKQAGVINSLSASYDTVKRLQKMMKDNEGFTGSVGLKRPGAYLPFMHTKEKTFQKTFDQLIQQLTLKARQAIKGQGTITDNETDMLRMAQTMADANLNEEDFKKAIDILDNQISTALEQRDIMSGMSDIKAGVNDMDGEQRKKAFKVAMKEARENPFSAKAQALLLASQTGRIDPLTGKVRNILETTNTDKMSEEDLLKKIRGEEDGNGDEVGSSADGTRFGFTKKDDDLIMGDNGFLNNLGKSVSNFFGTLVEAGKEFQNVMDDGAEKTFKLFEISKRNDLNPEQKKELVKTEFVNQAKDVLKNSTPAGVIDNLVHADNANPILTVGGGVGNLVSDVVGNVFETADDITGSVVSKGIENVVKGVIDTPVGQAGINALQKGKEAWDKYSQENPEGAKNVASLMGMLKGYMAWQGAKATYRGGKAIANGLKKLGEKGANEVTGVSSNIADKLNARSETKSLVKSAKLYDNADDFAKAEIDKIKNVGYNNANNNLTNSYGEKTISGISEYQGANQGEGLRGIIRRGIKGSGKNSSKADVGKIVEVVKRNPDGFTVDLRGNKITKGYAFSPFKENETIINPNNIEDDLFNFLKNNKKILSQKGHYFGGWRNPENGKYYLDISKVANSKINALKEGLANDQIAIYDLVNHQELPTKKTLIEELKKVYTVANKQGKFAGAIEKIKPTNIIDKTQDKVLNSRLAKAGSSTKRLVKVAEKTGFKETDAKLLATLKPREKTVAKKMVILAEKAEKNPRALKRPIDVVGENMVKKQLKIDKLRQEIGSKLDEVAKGIQGKKIDDTEIKTALKEAMQKVGVTKTEDGLFDFSNSQFRDLPAIQKRLAQTFNNIENIKGNAYKAHISKKTIDELVNYGTAGEGLKGTSEVTLKGLRHTIDSALDNQFTKYGKINKIYGDLASVTRQSKKLFGKDGISTVKAGGKIRSVFSNSPVSRGNTLQYLKMLDEVAKKYKVATPDNLVDQGLFAEVLEEVYGAPATTSLQGEVGKALVSGGVAKTPSGIAIKGITAGINAVRSKTPRLQKEFLKRVFRVGK